MKIGSELVLGCSELWAFGIDHPSAGMAAEIELAKAHGIPVRNGFEGIYAAMIEKLDDSVDRICQVIKTLGIADRTIVIFYSDNGPWELPKD